MSSVTIDGPVIPTEETKAKKTLGGVVLTLWGAIGLLFLFFPVLVIIAYSFNDGRQLSIWEKFGFAPYLDAFSNDAILKSVGVSFQAATGAALLSAVLGTLAGIAFARSIRSRWLPTLIGLLGLVMVTPEIVNAVSLLPWFVELGTNMGITAFSNGIVRLVIGHSLFSSAVVTFIVRARVAGLNPQLEEAAADLGAAPWRRFTDITLPLIAPAAVSGALLSFTLSLDNTVLSSFISVAGTTAWPVYVWSSMKASLRPEIAAMSTVMLLLTILVLLLVALVLTRASKKTGQDTDLSSMLG